MGRIEGEIVIGRPVEVVFDYVADQSNEPQYNPQMVRAEKITAGPVGKGTRFRSAVASRGRAAEMLIECTGYDWPRLFATTTTMAQADIGYTLRFEPARRGHPDALVGAGAAQRRVAAARPGDHLAGKTAGAADLGGPETAPGSHTSGPGDDGPNPGSTGQAVSTPGRAPGPRQRVSDGNRVDMTDSDQDGPERPSGESPAAPARRRQRRAAGGGGEPVAIPSRAREVLFRGAAGRRHRAPAHSTDAHRPGGTMDLRRARRGTCSQPVRRNA